MKTPLYQGTQYTPARVPQAAVSPQHPFADNFLKSAAAQTQQALDLESAIRDRQEYTLEQNRSAALQAAHQALDTEMIQRLNIADGEDGSLYDANGILIKSELDELRSRYLSVADAWTSGFTTDQGRAAATQAQQQYRAAVTNAINSKILAGLKTRAKNAMQNNIKACISRGNYQGAYDAANIAKADKRISAAEKADIDNDIGRSLWDNIISGSTSADELRDQLSNPSYQPFLDSNPDIREAAQRKISSILTYQAKPRMVEEETITSVTDPDSSQQTKNSSTKSSTGVKIVPAQAPPASDGWVQHHFFQYGSNLKSYKAQKNALVLLRKEAALHITDPNDSWQSNDIRVMGNSMEMPKDTIDAVIDERKKNLTAPLPKFSVDTAITAIKRRFDASKALRDNAIKQGAKAEPDMAEAWKTTLKEHDLNTEDVLEAARHEFEAWFTNGNQNAHEVKQAAMFQQILARRMQENAIIAANPQHSWAHLHLDEFFNIYKNAENSAAKAGAIDQYSRKTLQEQLKADTATYNRIKNSPELFQAFYRNDYIGAVTRVVVNKALAYQAANIRFESPMDSPSKAIMLPGSTKEYIIYTNPDPKKTSTISRQDSIIIKQNNKVFPVKIVETDAVSAPVCSLALRDALDIKDKSNYLYFVDNRLIFTTKAQTKNPKRRPAQQSAQNISPANTDDGLTPQEEWEGITEEDVNPYYQESIFAGVPLSAEDNMPTGPLPF